MAKLNMYETEFVNKIKKELSGRFVPPSEIEQYKIVVKENSLQYEFIIQAINFAKIIKGTNVTKQYIMALIKNWLEGLKLYNPSDVRNFFRNKYPKNKSKKPEVTRREYTDEQYASLFDNINEITL